MRMEKQKGFSLIELLIVVAIIGIIAAIAVPNMIKAQQSAHETAAIENVKAIGQAQTMFIVGKGHGTYGQLADLGADGILDSVLASGQKTGYMFTSVPVTVDSGPTMYDTTAKPTSVGKFGSANRSFGSNETNVVYEADGMADIKGTQTERIPQGAKPIQ